MITMSWVKIASIYMYRKGYNSLNISEHNDCNNYKYVRKNNSTIITLS
jgi:hypothetical protein